MYITGVVNGTDFDEGAGRIWLDNVQCTGSENHLLNCSVDSSGANSCSHDQDVGVRCLPGDLYSLLRAILNCTYVSS